MPTVCTALIAQNDTNMDKHTLNVANEQGCFVDSKMGFGRVIKGKVHIIFAVTMNEKTEEVGVIEAGFTQGNVLKIHEHVFTKPHLSDVVCGNDYSLLRRIIKRKIFYFIY